MDLLSTAAQHQTVVGDAASETQHVLSKEDFLKLMLPDSPLVEEGRRKVSYFREALKLSETLKKVLKRPRHFRSPPHMHSLSRFYLLACAWLPILRVGSVTQQSEPERG